MSTVREDILLLLQDPARFAAGLPPARADLWRRGLTAFARPRLGRAGSAPLRPAQEAAWEALADQRAGLLLGPPGTGKTHLLAWMAAGYLDACQRAGLPCRTLVTGFTRESMANLLNKVAEVAAVELPGVQLAFLGPPPDGPLDRLVTPLGLRGKSGLRDGWAFLTGNRHAIVAATNWSLGKLLRFAERPEHPALEADGQTARLFDLVLVDEASQILVSQGLMSLAGLAQEGRIIVCGDDRQLAPVRTTSEATLGGRQLGGSLYRLLASARVKEAALEDTFRLNAPLIEFPAREFYGGRFFSAVPDRRLELLPGWSSGLTDWERLVLSPDVPIVVLLHDGPPAGTDNPFERDLIARLVERLANRLPPLPGRITLDEETLWTRRLAVVTPHRAQNAAIRQALAAVPLCRTSRIETVDKVQGQERDVVIVGYTVADGEFAQAEADFLFDPGRLNVAVTRPKSKLILIVNRRLLEVAPAEEDTFEAADLLRRYVHECRLAGYRALSGRDGDCRVEFRVCGFDDTPALDLGTPSTHGGTALPLTRLTYPGDPPTNDAISARLGLQRTVYLYVTATMAQEIARRELASPAQRGDDEPLLRFDRLLQHLLRPRPVLFPHEQRVYLQRGIRAAIQDPHVAEAVLHDVPAWLTALAELEQRGEDVTRGFRPELRDALTSPALEPVLTALQKGYRSVRPAEAGESYEAAARRFLDTSFNPPPLVVMEGFTYLFPLQQHFVRKCLEKGSRIVFIHPHDPGQPDAFAVMDRTYAPYTEQIERQEVATPHSTTGHDLSLLQRGLFAERAPATPVTDGSVTVRAYAHRHRELAGCLERVKTYLAKTEDGGEGLSPGKIAIVTRNSGEFLTILQEEARRLGLLDRLRIEPRLLLLTPLGRFALSLYDMNRSGQLEITAERFETMIASGWLGAAVQQTVHLFAAVRPQAFNHCETVADWEHAIAHLTVADRAAPELARLPSTGVGATHVEAWQKALKQVVHLHARLFDNRPRSIAEHIRRLRDELSQLNPDDLRTDEKELVERIIEALQQVVGGSVIQVDDSEMSDLLAGVARGEHPAEDEPDDPTKVWVTTPETIDSVPPGITPDIVFYLGVDADRVPRPAGMPWPFFALTGDADAERERYLFLAVVRAARNRLHLSYSQQGEDETYGPSPYLSATARLLNRESDLSLAVTPPASRPTALSLPVLPGQADEYDLSEVAVFGLCPYRFRLERFDESARRFQEPFQLHFVVQGVWLDHVFEQMVGAGTFRDAKTLREKLIAVASEESPGVRALFPALGTLDRDVIARQMKGALSDLVDKWLAQPKASGKAPLDWGVTFEHVPPAVQFTVEVGGRTVIVRSGLRHVVRVGKVLHALPNALTHLHWLLPSYRAGDHQDRSADRKEQVEGIDVFAELETAVKWWTGGIRAALGKDSYPDQYRADQAEIAQRIDAIQAGRFPKHPGTHCELCPVRHSCLGVHEL